MAGCCPHSGRPCGGIYRRMNCPSGVIPVQSIGPCIRSGPMIMEPAWSGPVPVPALYRNPAHCGGLVARPSPAFARRPPPVPPCRPSGVRGKSVLPGGGGGSLPGLLVALCPVGPSAGSWPSLCSGLPVAPVGPAPPGPPRAGGLVARGPLPPGGGPGRPLAAGGPGAAVPPGGSAPGLFSRGLGAWSLSVGGAGGPVARPQAGSHPTDRGRASGGRQGRLTVRKK